MRGFFTGGGPVNNFLVWSLSNVGGVWTLIGSVPGSYVWFYGTTAGSGNCDELTLTFVNTVENCVTYTDPSSGASGNGAVTDDSTTIVLTVCAMTPQERANFVANVPTCIQCPKRQKWTCTADAKGETIQVKSSQHACPANLFETPLTVGGVIQGAVGIAQAAAGIGQGRPRGD